MTICLSPAAISTTFSFSITSCMLSGMVKTFSMSFPQTYTFPSSVKAAENDTPEDISLIF